MEMSRIKRQEWGEDELKSTQDLVTLEIRGWRKGRHGSLGVPEFWKV